MSIWNLSFVIPSAVEESRGMTQKVNSRGILGLRFAPLRMTACLFRRGKRLVQPRLATIGGVAMNDPTFGRFVDSRNRRANLFGGALWR